MNDCDLDKDRGVVELQEDVAPLRDLQNKD